MKRFALLFSMLLFSAPALAEPPPPPPPLFSTCLTEFQKYFDTTVKANACFQQHPVLMWVQWCRSDVKAMDEARAAFDLCTQKQGTP